MVFGPLGIIYVFFIWVIVHLGNTFMGQMRLCHVKSWKYEKMRDFIYTHVEKNILWSLTTYICLHQ